MKPIRRELLSRCRQPSNNTGSAGRLRRRIGARLTLLALLMATKVMALGLGEVTGSATIGETLSLRIPLIGDDALRLTPDCIQLDKQPGIDAGFPLNDAQIQLDGRAGQRVVSVRSSRPLTEPIVAFGLRVGCGHGLSRPYQLLAKAPQLSLPEASPSVAAPLPLTQRTLPLAAHPAESRTKPAAPASVSGGQLLVEQATTLRLISRHRFPANARARVRFIERIAAANPQRFADVKSAYDAPLRAQEALALPGKTASPIGAPVARTTELSPTNERPAAKKRVTEATGAAQAPAGQGRLIIGVDAMPRRTLLELQDDLDRLVEINNEQVLVQISLLERIKQLEQTVGEVKKFQAEQQAENQRLKQALRDIKEETRNGFILLGIALLSLGAIIGLLLHRLHVRTRQLAEQSWQRPSLLDPLPEAFTAKTVKAFKSLYHGR